MKRILFFIGCFITLAGAGYAQDVIVTREAEKISARVIEIDDDNVRYKKSGNPDGPTYSMRLSRVLYIRYANGSVDRFPANMRIKLPAVSQPEDEEDGDEYPVVERRAKPLNRRAASQRYEQDGKDTDSRRRPCPADRDGRLKRTTIKRTIGRTADSAE
jgi:hypothetical protein